MSTYERVDVGGKRHYVTPLGRLPSVTTILGATKPAKDKEGLAMWRRKVGEVEANRVLADSAARGTRLHGMVEDYLHTGVEGSGPWWESIAPFVRSVDRTRPHSIEQSVCSRYGYAGAYDFLGYAGDEETTCDWKTSAKRKPRSWVRDYELQAAAYTGCINEVRMAAAHGAQLVRRAAIVIAYNGTPADVYVMDAAELKAAWREFIGRVGEYQVRYGKAAK